MASWSEFRDAAPEIAGPGEKQLFQFGPGLVFLATVRPDGGPRLHPVCINLVEAHAYLLLGPSPKRNDLIRDGRFALHSFPGAESDDEFYLTGTATVVEDPETTERVAAAQIARGATTSRDEIAFQLSIERALYSRYRPRGTPDNWPPEYLKWRA